MSVLDGYNKYKRYIKTNDGYKLCSQWTSSNTVQMDDGNTLQTNLGAINGITDSLTATSSNIAASAAAVKTLNDSLNTRLNFRVTNVLSNGANTNGTTNHVNCTGAFTVNSPIATSKAIAIVILPLKFSNVGHQGHLGIKVGSKNYYGRSGDSAIITFADDAYVPVVELVNGITLAQGNNTCYGLIHSSNASKTIYSLASNCFRVLWIIQ